MHKLLCLSVPLTSIPDSTVKSPASNGKENEIDGTPGKAFQAPSLPVCVPISLTLAFTVADPAWQLGNPSYQELKAEVTEVPAPKQIQENSQDSTGMNSPILPPSA